MTYVSIKKLMQGQAESGSVGERIALRGWIRSLRQSKNVAFAALSDGTTQEPFQVVLGEALFNHADFAKITTGACCEFVGTLESLVSGEKAGLELHATEFIIHGEVAPDYPLQKKKTSLDYLRDFPHLRVRTNTFGAIFRMRHALSMSIHNYFNQREFFYLHSPIISGSDGEGAGAQFRVTTLPLGDLREKLFALKKECTPKDVNQAISLLDPARDYFEKPVHLCVTGQLEGEAFALGLSKVYTFGPTFRAENSNTPRHLAEFWMIEPEMAFYDLNDNADLATDFLKVVIGDMLKNCEAELSFLQKNYQADLIPYLQQVVSAPVPRISYREAVKILNQSNVKFNYPVSFGTDLQTEHERFLTEEHFKSPLIVTDYPKGIKAFYMRQNEDEETVAAMDVLVPKVGEIIGGSQREERLDLLSARMEEMKLPLSEYQSYLDLRRFGGCKHAGFGLGFERLLRMLTGMENIRDVVPYPRTPGRCP